MRSIHLSLLLVLAMCSVSFSATNISSCQAITAPGTYELISDLSGAPIDASPVTGTSCIKIATSDVVLDCKGAFNIENNGTGGTTIGIHINGTSTQPIDNVTVKNCTKIANYSYGVYASYLNDSSFTRVWALGNTQDGFKFDNCDHITLSECTGNNNGGYGYYAENPQYHTVNEFTAATNGGGGVFSTAPFGGYISGSSTFDNADDGIRVDGGSGLSISGTSSNNNGNNGISIDGSTNTIIDDSAVSNNTRDGIWLNGTNTISVNGITSSGNQRDGISLDGSTNTIIDDSAISGNVRDGILSIGDDNFTISGTSSNNNGRHGISLDGSTSTISDESEVSGNTRHGISLDGSTLTLSGSSSSSNRENGIYSYRSSLDATDFVSYANAKEMVVNDTGTISMSGVEFRPFSGNREKYTVLSISDTISSGESYSIKWNYFRGVLPSGLSFLDEKIVEISVESGSPSVDSITWHWSDDEVMGINEAGIELWKNSEAVWSQVSGDINTALNTFIIRDHTSFSTFALFHNGSASYTANLDGVNVTNITHQERYISAPAGNLSTEGGTCQGPISAQHSSLTGGQHSTETSLGRFP